MTHIREIAAGLGIDEQYVEQYGSHKAKIDCKLLSDLAGKPDGKLVLVTAITPTPPERARPPPRWASRTACGESARKA
jgi:formate--tetrahydrofolate ligase